MAIVDVLNVKLKNTKTTESDLVKNKIISMLAFIFYDYDDVFKMKTIMETGIEPPFNPPSLASMAQHQLDTRQLSTARQLDLLGLKVGREIGGKKTKNRRKCNKKSKRFNLKRTRKPRSRK
jgi:hypothetical protein